MNTQPRLGIVAGGGSLPFRLAAAAREAGRDPYILAVAGFASAELIADYGGEFVSIGEIGKQVRLLRGAGCEELVFGGIVKRPDFGNLRLDLKGVRELPTLAQAASKGDDALLRAVIGIFEREGFQVVGAETVFAGLLAQAGTLGTHKPASAHYEDMMLARQAVKRLGELDIGQAAVAREGLILAVEAQEGTDAMLERCAELPSFHDGKSGVLVKAPKPVQERRIDLPTLGVKTIEGAIKARLAGIGIEANATLLLDREEVLRLANEAGLFLHAFEPEVDK